MVRYSLSEHLYLQLFVKLADCLKILTCFNIDGVRVRLSPGGMQRKIRAVAALLNGPAFSAPAALFSDGFLVKGKLLF